MKQLLAIALAFAATASAVTIEDTKTFPHVTTIGGLPAVSFEDATFIMSPVPTEANRFENSTTLENHPDMKARLDPGPLVSAEDAKRALVAYYGKTAIDANSVVIRDVIVGNAPTYTVWCDNPSLFGCLNMRGAAGTWVELHLNGRNSYGGMTGFQRTIYMIKKIPKPQ